MHFLRHSI